MTDDFVIDENGNKASIAHFGSRKAAESSLKTLMNCTDCTNCTRCTNCTNCTDCTRCTRCTNCTDCTDCTNCFIISETERPLIVGPFRSDRYQFVINNDGGVRAGCRVFDSITEARSHWVETRKDTLLGDETMMILDFLEMRYKALTKGE